MRRALALAPWALALVAAAPAAGPAQPPPARVVRLGFLATPSLDSPFPRWRPSWRASSPTSS